MGAFLPSLMRWGGVGGGDAIAPQRQPPKTYPCKRGVGFPGFVRLHGWAMFRGIHPSGTIGTLDSSGFWVETAPHDE